MIERERIIDIIKSVKKDQLKSINENPNIYTFEAAQLKLIVEITCNSITDKVLAMNSFEPTHEQIKQACLEYVKECNPKINERDIKQRYLHKYNVNSFKYVFKKLKNNLTTIVDEK